MRRPCPANTPIDTKRFKRWIDEFGGYRHSVTRASIEDWLAQFRGDRDLAARVLDSVDYYGPERIAGAFRSALQCLEGWDSNPNHRRGRWRFVAFSSSAGESGDTMLHQFRLANNLDHRRHNEMFIHRSELISQRLAGEDTVVLLDDLTSTGEQVCNAWNEHFNELVAGVGQIFLMVVVAGKEARKRILQETDLRLVAGNVLDDSDNLFSPHCSCFTKTEKSTLLEYAEIADRQQPKGYGDCGLLLVFQHRCPNNTVPFLHRNSRKWTGLSLRHD